MPADAWRQVRGAVDGEIAAGAGLKSGKYGLRMNIRNQRRRENAQVVGDGALAVGDVVVDGGVEDDGDACFIYDQRR